jgi:rubrerythrin
MVTKTQKDGEEVFLCEVCGFGYLDKETAQSCQDWCSSHHSCSIEITKKAVTKGNLK